MATPPKLATAKSKRDNHPPKRICVRKLPSGKFWLTNGITTIFFKGKLINLKKLYENIEKAFNTR